MKKTRENPNPKPLSVWNGKLIERDVRPSQNGAYTNFVEEFDQPIVYNDTESSDDSSEDDDSRASSPTYSIVSRYSAQPSNAGSRAKSPTLPENTEWVESVHHVRK